VHEEHTGQEWQQLNSQQRLYLLSDFCKFSLPYTDPGNVESWKRINGNTLYTVNPNLYVKDKKQYALWPYGKIARLLLIWISTQVMLHKADNLMLTLPQSLNQLMKEIGIYRHDGKPNGREYNRYRVALQAICGMRTQVTTYEGDDENGMMAGKNLIIADTYNLGWGFKTMGELSTISLNKSTYEHMQHSTPLDAAAVFLLTNTNPLVKGRSRGQDLDLYTWLNARNYSLIHSPSRQTSPITWQQLANQFGNTYGRLDNFIRRFKSSLNNVRMVWPDLNVEIIDGQGIILHRSKRSVTAKRKPTGN
ncbi:MAG: replication protein RepA, partial [Bifidobacterium aquikefiri]